MLRLLLALLVAFPLSAGIRFDFATEVAGYSYRGRMAVDGTSTRVDITEGIHPVFNPGFSIITRKNGAEIVVLDHTRKTYFLRNGSALGGHLSTTRGIGKSTASRASVRGERDGRAHRLAVSYRLAMEIEGETIGATVELEAITEFGSQRTTALPWGLQFGAKTGFAELDEAIAARLPDRLPLRQTVKASRQLDGGPVVTETITTTLDNVTQEELDPETFIAPEGYRHAEPEFDFG